MSEDDGLTIDEQEYEAVGGVGGRAGTIAWGRDMVRTVR